MRYNIYAIGRLKEPHYKAACAEYLKRLGGSAVCEELTPAPLPSEPSAAQIEKALATEAELFRARLKPRGYTIAMCIEGKQLSGEELARLFSDLANRGISAVNFLVGSSYGLSEEIKGAAELRLSMSKMTFPHELARVMLLEQIYRAESINAGGKYNK